MRLNMSNVWAIAWAAAITITSVAAVPWRPSGGYNEGRAISAGAWLQKLAAPKKGMGALPQTQREERSKLGYSAGGLDGVFEISYLSLSEDEIGTEADTKEAQLDKRQDSTCYDVPMFALNYIIGRFPPQDHCVQHKEGERSISITCYHPPAKSTDEHHYERASQFLSLCDTQSRPELLMT